MTFTRGIIVEIWEPVGNPALVSLGESLTGSLNGGLTGGLNGSLEGHPLHSQLYTTIEQTSFNVYVATPGHYFQL